MSKLLRATAISGRPVVTLDGESPFQVKDVVFDRAAGRLIGFTLRKHGFFSRSASEFLPIDEVHGLGGDAVMVASSEVFEDDDSGEAQNGGDVIGGRILTESGTDLGEVVEAIISTGSRMTVVGFEVEPSEELNDSEAHVFIPLPEVIAISGDQTVVPDSVRDFVRDDLTGFGAAVDRFRAQIKDDA